MQSSFIKSYRYIVHSFLASCEIHEKEEENISFCFIFINLFDLLHLRVLLMYYFKYRKEFHLHTSHVLDQTESQRVHPGLSELVLVRLERRRRETLGGVSLHPPHSHRAGLQAAFYSQVVVYTSGLLLATSL